MTNIGDEDLKLIRQIVASDRIYSAHRLPDQRVHSLARYQIQYRQGRSELSLWRTVVA
jgi:hypothetical protein